jgi:hypothetical protein
MAALVDLEDAKRHLRITDDTQDADVALKIDQASAIILDYLKGRTLFVDEITRVGAVATVTTIHPHGLSTGHTVRIRGALQPEYNLSAAVTVTSTTAFTFAVAATADTPATGPIAIRAEETWTSANAPGHVQAAVLLMLGHLFEHRGDDPETDGDLWLAIERLLIRSRDPAYA